MTTPETRIDRRFAALAKEERPAVVTFISAGDPDYDTSLKILQALPKAGADIVELGMPFSDPMAEGPPIQRSSQRALRAGQTMVKTLDMVRAFRQPATTRRRSFSWATTTRSIFLRQRALPRRCQGCRRRRSDRRRSPAGGRRRTLHSRTRARYQFHPPGDADDRRQAAAERPRQHFGLCLLRLDSRHHRHRITGCGKGCRRG